MSKKGASMEEGVGLQCQRAEVNVKERSKQKGVGFTVRRKQAESSRVHSKEKASRKVRTAARFRSLKQAVLPFLFLELRRFFSKNRRKFY